MFLPETKTSLWVFCFWAEWYHPSNSYPRKMWTRITKAAGIENLHIHDLRRSLGSWQAAAGASLPIIGRSLRHADLKATQVYARLQLDSVRESVTKATSAMIATAKIKKNLVAGEIDGDNDDPLAIILDTISIPVANGISSTQ